MNYYRESTIRAALERTFSPVDAAAAMQAIKKHADECSQVSIIDSDKLRPNITCHTCGLAGYTDENGFVHCTQGEDIHEPDDFCKYAKSVEDLCDYDDHTVSGLLDD